MLTPKLFLVSFLIGILIVAYLETTYTFKPCELSRKLLTEKRFGIFFAYQITRIPANLTVVESKDANITIGISIDPWVINFGEVPKGVGVKKEILVTSSESLAKVYIRIYGNISKVINPSENAFLIKSGEQKVVKLYANITSEVKEGNYMGEVDIIVLKPKFPFILFLLRI